MLPTYFYSDTLYIVLTIVFLGLCGYLFFIIAIRESFQFS